MKQRIIIAVWLIFALCSSMGTARAKTLSIERIDPVFLEETRSSEAWIPVIIELQEDPGIEHGLKLSPLQSLPVAEDRDLWLNALQPYQIALRQGQDNFLQWCKQRRIALIPYQHLTLTLNAIAAEVRGEDIERLLAHPKIYRIHDDRMKFQLLRQRAAKTTRADQAWKGFPQFQVPALSGNKQLIGIIDTGLDYNHPEFTRSKKVRGGWNLADDNDNIKDSSNHGTHVAGIAAGQGGREDRQGMAYDADLMIYKIFSEDNMSYGDVLGAMERSVADRCTIVNLSLGGGTPEPSKGNTAYHRSIGNADKAGVFVVAAAGNSGSRRKEVPWPISIPSLIDEAFSVGASDDRSDEAILIIQAKKPDQRIIRSMHLPPTPPFKAELLKNGLVFAHHGLSSELESLDLRGKTALIKRGPLQDPISFRDKVENAIKKGAVGVILFNHTPIELITPTLLNSGEAPDSARHLVPTIMVTLEDGEYLKKSFTNSLSVQVEYQPQSVIANFSSMGFTSDGAFKPEITAPGTQIISPVPQGQYAAFDGTSMATPCISGLSALLKQARPSWSHSQIKSAFMNTADLMINPYNQLPITFTLQGAGSARLDQAINTPAFIEPRALVISKAPQEFKQSFTLENAKASRQTFTLQAEVFHLPHEKAPLSLSFNVKEISVDANRKASFTVTFDIATESFLQSKYEGIIRVGDELHIPFVCYKDAADTVEDVISNIRLSSDSIHQSDDLPEEESSLKISFSFNAGLLWSIHYEGNIYYNGFNYGSTTISVVDEEGEVWTKLDLIKDLMPGEYTYYWNGKDSNQNYFLPSGRFFIQFSTTIREYKDNQWVNKPYDYYRKPFQVTQSSIPSPVSVLFSTFKIIGERQELPLNLTLGELKKNKFFSAPIQSIEFELHYDAERFSYRRTALAGFFAREDAGVSLRTQVDDNEGLLKVMIQCPDMPIEEFKEQVILKVFFRTIKTGRASFQSQGFKIRLSDNREIRVKALMPNLRIVSRDYLLADLNGDKIVDRLDFAIFTNAYGSRKGDENFNEDCDFNQDLKVDLLDLQILSQEMGKYIN